MKQTSTLFLKIVILLVAIGVLIVMLWFPQTEGRAANLDPVSIYKDPFIIYIYLASIPFFVGLYQAVKLLNFIDANKAFSQGAVNTLMIMKFASFSLIIFIALAEFYIRFFAHGDDPAGPMMLGIIVSFSAAVIATATAVFQKLLQNAVDIKSEND
ncbi:MAG TPA: DUF2975 domain-containing protein, partial [Candidatus Saccharimonadales bacterium]|nr:DUF2975 domain-containing protein [Candidatus Saccharimonadales bacterium]